MPLKRNVHQFLLKNIRPEFIRIHLYKIYTSMDYYTQCHLPGLNHQNLQPEFINNRLCRIAGLDRNQNAVISRLTIIKKYPQWGEPHASHKLYS